MEYFDSHSHYPTGQKGGILIALEGEPVFPGTLDNDGLQPYRSNPSFLCAHYITAAFQPVADETVLKYHPRRERYSSDEVIADLHRRQCRLCVIDTLNQPQWSYLDYWKVVAAFPGMSFILPHAGGYDILDFIKILDFSKNVWMDFSMTQEYFGWCGERAALRTVCDGIDFCLDSQKLHRRILFGSDEPFFSQQAALEKYADHKHADALLRNNFRELLASL